MISTHASVREFHGLIKLLRPKQWIKNGFVLAPLVFAGAFLDVAAIQSALGACLLFCLASSAAYVMNDLHDVEQDRLHPKKSLTRPLASGEVTPLMAQALIAVLWGTLAVGCFFIPGVTVAVLAYLLLNLAYTFYLKNEPVLDIFTIAIGFELRVYGGAKVLGPGVSMWMLVTTMCLALFLASIKRRQELKNRGVDGRKVLTRYSVELVDRYAEMSATGALLFYGMFVMAVKPQLAVTIPLVLFGLFRYWYVVEKLDGGESPTDELLADWQLLLTVVAWIATCAWALWPH